MSEQARSRHEQFHARARGNLNFHGFFYGRKIFSCKIAQFCDALRKLDLLGVRIKSTLRNAAKICAIR
jgi:hypothetical protein